MGPGYYVIAILGCADGSTACVPAATMPRHFESEAACEAAAPAALMASTDLDFPTLVARCRGVTRPAADSDRRPVAIPAGAVRG